MAILNRASAVRMLSVNMVPSKYLKLVTSSSVSSSMVMSSVVLFVYSKISDFSMLTLIRMLVEDLCNCPPPNFVSSLLFVFLTVKSMKDK